MKAAFISPALVATAAGEPASIVDLVALRNELQPVFRQLCSLASSGSTLVNEALQTADDHDRGDLLVAADALLGQLGMIGELGARACGDPGFRRAPSDWLGMGQALQHLEGLGGPASSSGKGGAA
jgi:hypothetical protein